MNQKGEILVTSCFLLFTLTALVTLGAMELRSSFSLLRKRTKLFLCVKEVQGEHHKYLTFMGRTNWGIRHANRAALVMIFIPGAQGAATAASKAKKILKSAQNVRLVSYLKTLVELQKKGCPIDPRMYLTPFRLKAGAYHRDLNGTASIRKNQWTYFYSLRPYLLKMAITATGLEDIHPKPDYKTSEPVGKLSSHYSSFW